MHFSSPLSLQSLYFVTSSQDQRVSSTSVTLTSPAKGDSPDIDPAVFLRGLIIYGAIVEAVSTAVEDSLRGAVFPTSQEKDLNGGNRFSGLAVLGNHLGYYLEVLCRDVSKTDTHPDGCGLRVRSEGNIYPNYLSSYPRIVSVLAKDGQYEEVILGQERSAADIGTPGTDVLYGAVHFPFRGHHCNGPMYIDSWMFTPPDKIRGVHVSLQPARENFPGAI